MPNAISPALVAFLLALPTTLFAQAPPSHSDHAALRTQAIATMKRAATFFRTEVATHGGYVYHYDLDLGRRWGEGVATKDQIWVQPPGTPAVGLAYVAAYQATGDRYYRDAIEEVANALIYGQLQSGGWANCIDFNPRGERVAQYRNGKGGGNNQSSLDDGQTQTAIRFLVQADQALEFKNKAIHQAVQLALDALLSAQFPCGAFPQGWDGPVQQPAPQQANYPTYDWRSEGKIKNYWDLYTLNDGLAVDVAAALWDAYQVYDDPRYLQALKRLGDFLILAQMPQPQPAWAQQYNYQMQPVWARRFEPPAISGHESQGIVALLMEIYQQTGDEKYLAPIQPAIDYLRRSTLSDGSLSRYYELRTNRPLYMQRDRDVYTLTYDDTKLPSHYGWKTVSKAEQLQQRFDLLKADQGRRQRPTDPAEQAAEVRAIIESLDAQGRWVSVADDQRLPGQVKFAPGERYLASAVFNENLQMLARFVAATATATADR